MSIRAIILAGQRPGPDALCDHAGVAFKADIEICGVSMLDRVADALREAGLAEPFLLSGYPIDRTGFERIDGGCGPADSALQAAKATDFPALLTTCDHALLTPDIVTAFLRGAEASGADFAIGLASEGRIQSDYPETKRTYLRFKDIAVSGCNLFYLRNERALQAIRFWRDAQHLRKKPLRLAAKIGPKIALRYAVTGLSMDDAFAYASRRIGASAAPVLIDIAEAAIDVDRPSDLSLAETILSRRYGAVSA